MGWSVERVVDIWREVGKPFTDSKLFQPDRLRHG